MYRRSLLSHRFSFPFMLFVVCVLSYGLLIPLLGFYWDDHPFLWFMRIVDPVDLHQLEIHRPLTGWLYSFLFPILQTSPIRWQLFNLINRYCLGLSVWWMLSHIWPNRKIEISWISLLVSIYPGFDHQYIAVNSSRHILSLTMLVLSFGFTSISMIDKHSKRWLFAIFAMILTTSSMLMTDYYYGLELLRLLIIYQALRERPRLPRTTLNVIKHWMPYLILTSIIIYWRFFLIEQIYYPLILFQKPLVLDADIRLELLRKIGTDFYTVLLATWVQPFKLAQAVTIGQRSIFLYWFIIVAVFCTSIYFSIQRENAWQISSKSSIASRKWNLLAITIGLLSVLLGGMSSWPTGIGISYTGIHSRFSLPVMMGSSLFLVGVLGLLNHSVIKMIVFSLFLSLSAGHQFETGVQFRWEWKRQKSFIWQLIWRIPDLEPGTLILGHDFPFQYEEDNALTATINWLYSPTNHSGQMDYLVYDVEKRYKDRLSDLSPTNLETRVSRKFGTGLTFHFEGSTSKSIVLQYEFPACLRIIQPKYDGHLTGLSFYEQLVFDYSDPQLINFKPALIDPAFLALYGPEETKGWCFYYQKADLARQMGNWELVYKYANQAMKLGHNPGHASEYDLFIEAFLRKNEYERAMELSKLVIARDVALSRMLCVTWKRSAQMVTSDPDFHQYFQEVDNLLNCPK